MTQSENNKKIFSLEGKGLKLDSATDVEKYINELREMEDIEEIRLQGNTLGVEACRFLGEILQTKKKLQVANFADIFTGRLLSEIPQALQHLLTALLALPNLHTINLNDNAFGVNTSAPLIDFLSSHIPLQHLHLNNNGLGPKTSIRIAEALVLLYSRKNQARKEGKKVPNLETIICGRNRLESGSMEAWARVFSLHNSVKEVRMVQNGIRPLGIFVLLKDGLRHVKDIKILDLEDNTFLTKGASILADIIPDWTELQELGVGDSLLDNKGSIMLAKALKLGKNRKLEVLRLQYNQISPRGLRMFSVAVKDSLPSLKRIEFNGNQFSAENKTLEIIRNILIDRKEKLSATSGTDKDWGLDTIESGESEDDDSSDESDISDWFDEDGDDDQVRQKISQMANEALGVSVVQLRDKNVDDLANKLGQVSV